MHRCVNWNTGSLRHTHTLKYTSPFPVSQYSALFCTRFKQMRHFSPPLSWYRPLLKTGTAYLTLALRKNRLASADGWQNCWHSLTRIRVFLRGVCDNIKSRECVCVCGSSGIYLWSAQHRDSCFSQLKPGEANVSPFFSFFFDLSFSAFNSIVFPIWRKQATFFWNARRPVALLLLLLTTTCRL